MRDQRQGLSWTIKHENCVSVNKTLRGLERGIKGVGSSDQRNVCKEKWRGESERKKSGGNMTGNKGQKEVV